MRNRPLLLLGGLLLTAGCSAGERAGSPIERQIYVEDLLPRITAAETRAELTLELPRGAALELGGSLHPAEGARSAGASARFVIRREAETLLERPVESDGGPAGFAAVLPLSGGGTTTLQLSIEVQPPGASAQWTWLSLLRVEPVSRQTAADGPNLLLLVVDTLRADHLGLYGYPRDTSPNLDRLADGATVFERAISASSWTHPATASLLTGLTPARHGVLGGTRLSPLAASLPQALQAEGFTTFGLSANPVIGRGSGFHRGFETFRQEPWARADEVNRALLGWLTGREELRWFAYLHYIDPHSPYDAPGGAGREFTGDYDGPLRDPEAFNALVQRVNEQDLPPGLEPEALDYLIGAYDGEIRFWDRELGVLLDALEERGLLQDTLVVVTSDHGEEFLEHGRLKHGMQLFEESLRVPLVLRGPAGPTPGRHVEQVGTRGLARALLDRLGVPVPGGMAEEAPSMLDPAVDPVISHTTLPLREGETHRRWLVSVRDTRWKAILHEDGTLALYDLEADPRETTDLAGGEPARAARYREMLETYLQTPALPQGRSSPLDEEMRQRLRALGYAN